MNDLDLEVRPHDNYKVVEYKDEKFLVLTDKQKEIIYGFNDFAKLPVTLDRFMDRTWYMNRNDVYCFIYTSIDENKDVPNMEIFSFPDDDRHMMLTLLGINVEDVPLDFINTPKHEQYELNEDNELDLEPVAEVQDLYDLYDELGSDLFSDGNIGALKHSNNIGENGLPITFNHEEDDEPRELTLSDLYQMDWHFISNKYIQDLIVNEFKRLYPEGLTYSISGSDLPSNRDMSRDFLEACMAGDVYDFFYGYDTPSFSDCSSSISEIDDKCLDLIESMGFPRDIYKQLDEGTEDDEHPLAEYYDDLMSALQWAVGDASVRGAEEECLNDFDYALKNDIPNGCEYKGREEPDWESAKYLITSDYVRDNVSTIWDKLEYNDLKDAVEEDFKESFDDSFSFHEPYSGWYGFDEEAMNDSLLDRLYELKHQIDSDLNKKNKKDEDKQFGEGRLFSLDDEGNVIPNKQESLNEENDLELEPSEIKQEPWVNYLSPNISKKFLTSLINFHGNKDNLWSLSLHDDLQDIWYDGNVYGFRDLGDKYHEYDGYFSFDDVYREFLDFPLNTNQTLYVLYNPLNINIDLYDVLRRSN